jgi:hypothetical protein
MRNRAIHSLAAVAMVFAFASPLRAASDARVTIDTAAGNYLRYDGESDATMEACSIGRRQQNEPTVAVDPADPDVVVAGSND